MRYLCLVLLFVVISSFAQNEQCAVKPLTDEERDQLPWVGDNSKLIDELSKRGYDLPKDYFSKVDELGYYKGQKWKFFHLKKDKQVDEELFQTMSMVPGATVYPSQYYIPLKIWIHADNNGFNPFTIEAVSDGISDANEIYNANGVPINFFFNCDSVKIITNSPHY